MHKPTAKHWMRLRDSYGRTGRKIEGEKRIGAPSSERCGSIFSVKPWLQNGDINYSPTDSFEQTPVTALMCLKPWDRCPILF